jgi:hypothetical protein
MNESHMPFYGALKFEEVRDIIDQIHLKIKLFRHNEGLRLLLFVIYTNLKSSQIRLAKLQY